jgi:hypothetical protein
MARGTATLLRSLERHPDVNLLFNPNSIYNNTNYYVYDFPTSTEYSIGIIFNPCVGNSYDCCMNVFGSPEYPALLTPYLESERVRKYLVIASNDEVQKNYYLVDEFGDSIDSSAQRTPYDYEIWNGTCVTVDVPYSYCAGRNYAYERSPIRPACEDNNSSINALTACQDPITGDYYSYCVQVAYSTTALIPQCETTDEHCGTYLEIHVPHGTPYASETQIINAVRLVTPNVTGYYTTILPLTYLGVSSRILCEYTETFLRVGSLVYIKSTAPVCCCPPPYSTDTGVGSFQCPVGSTNNGAFAYAPYSLYDTLLIDELVQDYPFCPIDIYAKEDL